MFGTGSKTDKAGLPGSSGRSNFSKSRRHWLKMASSSSAILNALNSSVTQLP